MCPWLHATIVLFIFGLSLAQEQASVDIKAAGPCSPTFLRKKEIRLIDYRPQVIFDPSKVKLDPPNPILPGCVTVKAENITILRPLKHVKAEFELRIGGSPNPLTPTIPCGRRPDADNCGCPSNNNTCLYCDFCTKLKSRQVRKISLVQDNRRKYLTGLLDRKQPCNCAPVEPGVYDIEAEVCSPPAEKIKKHVPPQIQHEIAEGRPIGLWVTVFIYDFKFEVISPFLSELGRKVMYKRRAEGTVGCYLIGTNVDVTSGRRSSHSGGGRTRSFGGGRRSFARGRRN